MKFTSYLNLLIGIFLIVIEFIFQFNGMMGYIVTTLGIVLSLFGLLLNTKTREFLVNLFINLS